MLMLGNSSMILNNTLERGYSKLLLFDKAWKGAVLGGLVFHINDLILSIRINKLLVFLSSSVPSSYGKTQATCF